MIALLDKRQGHIVEQLWPGRSSDTCFVSGIDAAELIAVFNDLRRVRAVLCYREAATHLAKRALLLQSHRKMTIFE